MRTMILVFHVLTALTVIGLVLLQHGKGADMGAAFGSGSSGSLFGSSGSANFLSRATAVLAAIFFITSMGLTWLSGRTGDSTGVMGSQQSAEQGQQMPPAPVPAKSSDSASAAPVPKAPSTAGQEQSGEAGRGQAQDQGVADQVQKQGGAQDGSKSNEIPK